MSALRTSSQGIGKLQVQKSTLTASGTQFLNYITMEVNKLIAAKRINERTIRELDNRVQMESYLREKKDAILEDRKNGHLHIQTDNTLEDDQKSCLQQVQDKYYSLQAQAADDAKSRTSIFSKKAVSKVAKSGVA